ncbi:MAG TPA: MFS transporter [Mycobacteriales bacterium]|jgi:MFS family permease|nr:MFS transporter [Mycobacteriales bacterium]
MTRFVPRRMRGLPRAVWVLVAGTLITRAGSFAVPFLTIYLHRERGLSLRYAGVAMAAYGAGGIVAALSGGTLADRLGRKPVVVGSPLLGGLSLVLLLVTQHPAAVVAVAFVAGTVAEAGRPAVSAMLTDLTPPERRVDAFALFRLVINLGFAVGTGLGGVLITHLGFARLFVADAATSWIYAVVALALLPETRPQRRPAAAGAPARGFGTVLADATFRRFWLASFVMAIVFAQTMVTLPLALTERGFSTQVYGALISVNGVVIILSEFWISGRTRRYRPPRVMAIGAVTLGGGYALMGTVGRSLPLLLATVLVWTLGEMLGSPTSQAYLAAIAPQDLRGRYAGGLGLAWSLAFTVGPLLGGTALAVGHGTLWVGSGVLAVASGLVFLTLPNAAPAATPVPAGVPARPVDATPVAPGAAIPAPRGRLLPRFARPRS